MPNPIIERYLKDKSIPLADRQKALSDIENDVVDENTFVESLNYHTDNKYAQPNIEDVSGKLNELIPGVGNIVKEVAPKVAQEQQIKQKLQEGISPVSNALAPVNEDLMAKAQEAQRLNTPEYQAALRYVGNPEDAVKALAEPNFLQKIGQNVKASGGQAIEGTKQMIGGFTQGTEEAKTGDIGKGFTKAVGGVLGLAGAVPGEVLKTVPGGETVGKALTPSTYTDFAIDYIAKSMGATPEQVQQWKEGVGTAANVAGIIVAPKVAKKGGEVISKAKETIGKTLEAVKSKVSPDIVTKRTTELQGVIDKNSPLRKYISKQQSKGVNPVQEIANSDVLVGAVDKEGVIRTKQEGGAISQYNETLKPAENIVTKIIESEGKNISLKDVQAKLTNDVMDSGLEGNALTKALSSVKAEMEGYKLRANPDGTIPVSLVQKAKISKYSGIDYLNEGGKIDKTIAKSLKELVEENTSADVKALNAELAKHYSAIGLLEKLDGVRVKGGRLGKYFAKTVGAVVGSHFGPLGSIIGSELAGRMEGKGMSKTFGKETGKSINLSPEMKSAIEGQSSNNLGNLKTNQSTTITPTKIPIDTTVAPTKAKVNKPFKKPETAQTTLKNSTKKSTMEGVNNKGMDLITEAKKYKSAEEFMNSFKSIKSKAVATKLSNLPSEVSNKVVVVDVNKFLQAKWYGNKPTEGGITTMSFGSKYPNKYVQAKDFIKNTKGNDIEMPSINWINDNGVIGNLEGKHRFLVFKDAGAKEMAISIPSKIDVSKLNWVKYERPSQLTDIWNKANKK